MQFSGNFLELFQTTEAVKARSSAEGSRDGQLRATDEKPGSLSEEMGLT